MDEDEEYEELVRILEPFRNMQIETGPVTLTEEYLRMGRGGRVRPREPVGRGQDFGRGRVSRVSGALRRRSTVSLKRTEPFISLVAALKRKRVRFLVIGVWGVNYYGSGATHFHTEDRDLFLPQTPGMS